MKIFTDYHIPLPVPPEGLLLVGIQNFPLRGHQILNFYIQGIIVFLSSAATGFAMGASVQYLAH